MAKNITKKELKKILSEKHQFEDGCLIDTSVLFGAILDTDLYHEDASEIISLMTERRIPRFINANIRSEFLNNARRVIIAEAAVDLYEDYGSLLPDKIYDKLRSLHRRANDAKDSGKTFRVQEEEIKQIKKLFQDVGATFVEPIWELFCSSYLNGKLQSEWRRVEDEMGINSISFTKGDSEGLLQSDLSWDEVIRVIENSGSASSDAMIINLFSASKLKLIITSDEDFAEVVSDFSSDDKIVCCL